MYARFQSQLLRARVKIPCEAGGNTGGHGILRFAQNDRVVREKIQSELHGDMQRVAEMPTPLPSEDQCEGVTNLSEIPCRVSSDLHEWRNESATVLPTDTANL